MHGRGERRGLLLGQGSDRGRPGEHAGRGRRLSLQMHGVDVVDEEAAGQFEVLEGVLRFEFEKTKIGHLI